MYICTQGGVVISKRYWSMRGLFYLVGTDDIGSVWGVATLVRYTENSIWGGFHAYLAWVCRLIWFLSRFWHSWEVMYNTFGDKAICCFAVPTSQVELVLKEKRIQVPAYQLCSAFPHLVVSGSPRESFAQIQPCYTYPEEGKDAEHTIYRKAPYISKAAFDTATTAVLENGILHTVWCNCKLWYTCVLFGVYMSCTQNTCIASKSTRYPQSDSEIPLDEDDFISDKWIKKHKKKGKCILHALLNTVILVILSGPIADWRFWSRYPHNAYANNVCTFFRNPRGSIHYPQSRQTAHAIIKVPLKFRLMKMTLLVTRESRNVQGKISRN